MRLSKHFSAPWYLCIFIARERMLPTKSLSACCVKQSKSVSSLPSTAASRISPRRTNAGNACMIWGHTIRYGSSALQVPPPSVIINDESVFSLFICFLSSLYQTKERSHYVNCFQPPNRGAVMRVPQLNQGSRTSTVSFRREMNPIKEGSE